MADAYVRVNRTGCLLFGPPEGFDSLLFVDVDPDGGDALHLREAPHTFVSGAGWLVVRSNAHDINRAEQIKDDLRKLSTRLQLRARFGLLVQPIGSAPRIEWLDSVPDGSEGLEVRAKAAEVRALLRWRGAVWEGKTYHYVLPSGRHASGFVKFGQAIAEPRDADVLASWLWDRFDSEVPSGLVLDSGTLTPLAIALRTAVGPRLGRVAVLNRYPSTDADVDRAIESATTTNRVVGLVSVCFSGHLHDRIRNALSRYRDGAERTAWSLDTIVDLRPDFSRDGQVRSWATLRHHDDAPFRSFDGTCELCRSFARSTLVPVDPLTFDAYLPMMRERHMPDIGDAGRNRVLWNACLATKCISVEAKPDEHTQHFRPTREVLPIKIAVGQLLEDEELRKAAVKRFQAILRKQPELKNVDLVLTLAPEAPGASRALGIVGEALGREPQQLGFPVGPWAEDLVEGVRRASSILVLSPGTVTGHTLQRALVGVQDARRLTSPAYRLFGLSVHARPGRRRDWQALSNSYGKQLYELFLSYLPRSLTVSSPLQAEADLLDRIVPPENLSPGAQKFWQSRRKVCAGKFTSDTPLFWGQPAGQVVSNHSIFGDSLDAVTTYTAMASALHATRQGDVSRPHRIAFELPAIFRSYYDPLIVASILRWIRPAEAWWGESPNNARLVVQDLITLSSGDPKLEAMIVAELLLAAALGKVPKSAADIVLDVAYSLRSRVVPEVLDVAVAVAANERSVDPVLDA